MREDADYAAFLAQPTVEQAWTFFQQLCGGRAPFTEVETVCALAFAAGTLWGQAQRKSPDQPHRKEVIP